MEINLLYNQQNTSVSFCGLSIHGYFQILLDMMLVFFQVNLKNHLLTVDNTNFYQFVIINISSV